MKSWWSFIIPGVIVAIIASVIILGLSGPKPIKEERIWGKVLSVNGNYSPDDKEPIDCHIISNFEDEKNLKLNASYRASYDRRGPTDRYEYDKCWKSLLLKPGDPVSAIKRTWPSGHITYELDP